MATKENTKATGNPQRSRTTATKKKKSLRQSIVGGTKKAPAKKTATKQSVSAQRSGAPRRRPDEDAIRQASAALQPQRRQVMEEQLNAAQQNLPEEVFNTTQQTRKEPTQEEKKRIQTRKKSAARAKERAVEVKKAANRPQVTYTQPTPFNLNKLLLQLAVVIAVVLAVVMGLSVFFKVDRVVVYGNDAYSAWAIQEASGIEGGENLLSFGRTRACGKIITALPYVKNVRIGIKLPDTVNIYIEEFDVSYAVEDANKGWWLMTSGGKIAEQIDKAKSNNYTKVEGIQLLNPVVGEQAVAMEVFEPESTEATETTSAEDTTPIITVTAADRLQAALLILKALEDNDIVGEVASVDVTSIFNLELRYGQRYQVKLGDTSDMDKKIDQMKKSVAQLNDYQTGILDISYVTWPDGPFYTPLT